ncbi:hypothetical protein J6590_032134 [Homalodisca vitripennis]|nr:hypothetical protein J6590_032134 [Homalodisca vitripennis]
MTYYLKYKNGTSSVQRAVGRLKGLHGHITLLPECAEMQIMQSMVLSVFSYCYPAYGNSITKEDAGRFQRLQNSDIRFIFSLIKFDHVPPSRKNANIIAMQDTLTTGEPEYLSERILRREDVSERSTRQRRFLHFPKVRLELGGNDFDYFGLTMFNGLPVNLKQIRSIPNFKLKLKEHFSHR